MKVFFENFFNLNLFQIDRSPSHANDSVASNSAGRMKCIRIMQIKNSAFLDIYITLIFRIGLIIFHKIP